MCQVKVDQSHTFLFCADSGTMITHTDMDTIGVYGKMVMNENR